MSVKEALGSGERIECILVAMIGLLGATISWMASAAIGEGITSGSAADLWFDSDAPRVFNHMVNRNYEVLRTTVHPIFPIIAYVPTYVGRVIGLSDWNAVRGTVAMIAALWMGLLFMSLRALGIDRIGSALFVTLGASSSAFMFWSGIPESFLFGSLTFLVAMLVACRQRVVGLQFPIGLFVNSLTLSITVTNWVAGIALCTVFQRFRTAALTTCIAFALVTGLWAIQRRLFPNAYFFVPVRQSLMASQKNHILSPLSGGPLNVTRGVFLNSIVVPPFEIRQVETLPSGWTSMTVQRAELNCRSFVFLVASALWICLFLLGLRSMVGLEEYRRLAVFILAVLGIQWVLHLIYGAETFLYSPHFLPWCVIVSAFGLLGKRRRLSFVLASGLVVCAGLNNSLQFMSAREYFHHQIMVHVDIEAKNDMTKYESK